MDALSITHRPKRWEEIIGQDRAVHVLQSILKKGKFRPKGIILEGVHGIGKTTTGYVAAKALMCLESPLGCGTCPSCLLFDKHSSEHPDFREIDAASHSGVEAARRVVSEALELPTLGQTRVILIDEAHSLSSDAWKVYLKPMETLETPCTFIFATTDGSKIPSTIRSRSTALPFNRVGSELITGLLVRIAATEKLDYEIDALKFLARASRGHVRDAVALLDRAADLGRIDQETVRTLVDTAYEDMAINVLLHLAKQQLREAVGILDEMARLKAPARAISELFSCYGRAIFGTEDSTPEERRRYDAVKAAFPEPMPLTAIFIKWTSSDRIPVDALPLFAFELLLGNKAQQGVAFAPPRPESTPVAPPPEPEPAEPPVRTSSLAARLNAKVVQRT